MMKKSVSALLEIRVLNALLNTGVEWPEITYHTGIYPADIAIPNGRIDAVKHYKLLKLHHKKTGGMDLFFNQNSYESALFINRENIYETLATDAHALTLLCLNCPDLNSAIQYYVRFRGIVGTVDTLLTRMDGNEVRATFLFEFPEFEYHVVVMINFIFLIGIVEFYCGRQLKLRVQSKSDYNKLLAYVYDYWGCTVEWNSDENHLFFEKNILEVKNNQYNPILYTISLRRVEREFQEIFEGSEFSAVVKNLVLEEIQRKRTEYHEHDVMTYICKRYNITRSTVFRKLAAEGTSFRQIEAQVKLHESIQLLKNTPLSIGEISSNLGFSSQSAFNRFFSDKMQTTPLRYRKN